MRYETNSKGNVMPSIFTFTPLDDIGDPVITSLSTTSIQKLFGYVIGLIDESAFSVVETVFDAPYEHKVYGKIGAKVTEVHDRTREFIEAAAQKILAKCDTHDDADYHGIADWVRDTDAFSALALGKYSSADALADKWHNERIG
jgi:hypothetical protein